MNDTGEPLESVWQQTVRSLGRIRSASQLSRVGEHATRKRILSAPVSGYRALPNVRVIELCNARSALVSWSDPLTGHYEHQLWSRRVARISGYCVLSGKAVSPGDSIYAPRRGRSWPANAAAVAHASAIVGAVERGTANACAP